jgi:hypothetical protein
MIFSVILVITALSIAACAAFFSVYGLAHVFAASFLSVMIMGVTLEAGKLVSTSFLYQYWDRINIFLKASLLSAVLGLMALTSMGIAGYLTAAYQTDTVGLRESDSKLISYTEELDRLVLRKEDMDRQISQLPSDYVAARQKLMKSFKSEYDTIVPRIEFLSTEKAKLQSTKITTESKVGPIIFISRALGKETDDAIFWLVVFIVVLFDPLAVLLTVAANIAIKETKARRQKELPVVIDDVTETDAEASPRLSIVEAARRQAVLERNAQKA